MIYTTNFSNIRNLPKRVIPIAICGSIPKWYTGLWFGRKLAPKFGFFSEWKIDHDNDKYVKSYKELVINNLDQVDIVNELRSLLSKHNLNPYSDIALVCYEGFGKFCHRHIVSEWLRSKNYECFEYNNSAIPEVVYKYINAVFNWENNKINGSLSTAEFIRSSAHSEMIDYYNLDYYIQATAFTRSYDMAMPRTTSNDKLYLKDKEVIARDLHSILSYYKYLNGHPIFGYYGE